MFLRIFQNINRRKSRIKGWWFKLLFGSKQLQIGTNFSCDTWPTIIIDKDAQVIIGDNVQLRRNVEVRSHNGATLTLAGNNRIDRGVRLLTTNQSKLLIGKGTKVGLYSVFNGGDDIIVGEKVLISGFVYLQTSMHNHKKGVNVQDQGFSHGPVKLENDVWIGAHAVILPNCTLGAGAVVGSNAVVTKSIEKEAIVGGVPAKVLKERA